eukprot:5249364-Pyramimonas_sp.AAC.1
MECPKYPPGCQWCASCGIVDAPPAATNDRVALDTNETVGYRLGGQPLINQVGYLRAPHGQ